MELQVIQTNEKAVGSQEHIPFPQSSEWGDILISEGKGVERLAVMDGGETVLEAQIVYMLLPFGWKYAFCPKGPVMKEQGIKNKEQIFNSLTNYFAKKRCVFFRFEPSLLLTPYSLLLKTHDINPRATTVLDLGKSLEELLAAMHAKTRYNIRLAEKKGLRVSREKNMEVFWNLMKETGKRDGFSLHEKKHYEHVFDSPAVDQITVYSGETPVAVGVFIGVGDTYTYLYGASDYEHRQLMAPYLVQWEGIRDGKQRGFREYDFFGIAPRKEIRNKKQEIREEEYEYDGGHQYAGVTRYKLGFGGETREVPGTFDLIISPVKYRMYQLLRRARRLF